MFRDGEIEEEYWQEIDEKTRQIGPARLPQLEDYESGDGGFSFWGRFKDRAKILDDDNGASLG